ncbi:response regulator [Oryzifoliimicrobium ureilyticus]|uniref:response regulator n=1 Tax=Oryzifoliimicrobium ureilyticus TaxID=3113724 RepID=UPI0030767C28
MKHVLIVDDDSAIRSLLSDYLTKFALKVTTVSDGQSMTRVLATEPIDLVIVDLNLGQEDGLELVRQLSSKSDCPVIIISGDRLEEADKVVGLELGAMDYITKPFGMREFLARVRTALRERPKANLNRERKSFHFNGWTLSVKRRQLTAADGLEVKLTAGEFNLLVAFLTAPKQVLSREQLLTASRVHQEEVFDRSIDVLILRLRRKLSTHDPKSNLIKTERGFGYYFDADVVTEQAVRASFTTQGIKK